MREGTVGTYRRALPDVETRIAGIIAALRDDQNRSFALAEFHDLLAELAPVDFGPALEPVDVRGLEPYVQNYVAAMVEQAANALGVTARRGRGTSRRSMSRISPRRSTAAACICYAWHQSHFAVGTFSRRRR